MMLKIEVFSEQVDLLGEGPLWDPQEERLYWIDSYGYTIHRADLRGTDRKSWSVPEPIGSMALRKHGGAIVSLRSGFYSYDLKSGEAQPISITQPDERRTRMNDGKVDRQGRFVAGSMDFEEAEPIGKLFQLGVDLTVTELDRGIICSNGPCWSPDGSVFYFADTGRSVIWAYDYNKESGLLKSRRVFARFKPEWGLPDGATVDSEGYVWSVGVYAGRLIRFAPDGVCDRIVGLPAWSATSISFGGPNLDIAFITSMGRPHHGDYHKEAEAGFVFAVHGLGVRGLPEPRFAG
jgi:L-arabinonolactonase